MPAQLAPTREEPASSRELSASGQEVASTVGRLIHRERQRNEVRLATVRVVAYSLVFAIDLLIALAGWRPHGSVGGPAVVILASAIAWVLIVKWYRPWFGFVAPLIDSVFILQLVNARLGPLGPASLSTTATGALACGILAASGAIRFDGRLAVWTTFLAALTLWGCVGIRADAPGMLYTMAALAAVGMFNAWLADLARRSLEGTLGREVLGRFVQRSVVDRAFTDPVSLWGTPKLLSATVLVSDLRDFTRLSELLEPAAVLELLNEVQTALANAVQHHAGTVDKFMGDGMLAVFGVPEPLPDHPARAVAAVRDIREALKQINARHPDRPPLRIGIGIHTGTLISGILGRGDRMELTVIGDTVNTASRLESMTKDLHVDVLLSAATAEKLDAELPSFGTANVRGRSKPITVYTLPPR